MRADSKVSAKKWPSRRCFAYNTLHLRVEELKSLHAALRILMLSSKHFIKAALKALCSQDLTISLKNFRLLQNLNVQQEQAHIHLLTGTTTFVYCLLLTRVERSQQK